MALPSGTGKICVACGEDCSNKPRTKDAKGRYYCQGCYERAKQRFAADRKASVAAAPAPLGLDGLVGGSRPSSLLDQLVEALPPPQASDHCSNCGYANPAGTVICTHCGFNAQTRRIVKPKVIRAPKMRQAGGTIWPVLVGLVSIIFGASGALLNGGSTLLNVLAAAQTSITAALFNFGLGGLITCLSLWLLRCGLRILRRDADVVSSIRKWAFVKALVYGSCLGFMLAVPNSVLEQWLATMDRAGGPDIEAATIKSIILLIMLWFLFWPAFVIVWFFIPRIQDDVEQW